MELLQKIFTPSMIVALIAVIFSVWHGRATRRHQRLSLRPLLRFKGDYRRDEYKGLSLVNKGTGPAIIVSFELWVRDVSIPEPPSGGKVREALRRMGLDLKRVNTWTITEGTVIQPRETIELARTREKKGLNKQTWELRKSLMILRIHVKYKSMYGELFKEKRTPANMRKSTFEHLESQYAKDRGEDTVVESPDDRPARHET